MSDIRILSPNDFDAMARIFSDAYPGLKITSEEDRQRFRQRALKLQEQDPTTPFLGLFRQGKLMGIMRLYDFSMNFRGTRLPTGGVGQVAVALDHKKEHVAKDMMLYSLRHFRQRRVPVVALYPFRPDFYRDMGFGYGTKMNHYRIKPSALPRGPSNAHVRYLSPDDRQALADCYHRVVDRTHGMIEKAERELRRLFDAPEHRIVGCEIDDQMRGYLAFTFQHGDNFITNDIHVQEFIYESQEALSELLTFLHTQADQIRLVIFTTADEHFHHLLLDPRNDSHRLIPDVYHETNTQGVGLMYRVVDVPEALDRLARQGVAFSRAGLGTQPCTLRLTVDDSFLPENAGSHLLHFANGNLRRMEGGSYDTELRLDITGFSSLLVGTVTFKALYQYGLADISDPGYVESASRIFAVDQKPVCTTQF